MLIIKKYANGRLYDTVGKTYLKKKDLVSLVKDQKKFKVVSTKTGKDVTRTVLAGLPAETRAPKTTRVTKDGLGKWLAGNRRKVRKNIEKQVGRIRRKMNFPTRNQVINLTTSVNRLHDRISDLEKTQADKIDALKKAQAARIKKMEAAQAARIQELEAQQAQQVEAPAPETKEDAAA